MKEVTSRLLLTTVSRSFALVIPMIDKEMRDEVENQYLLARLLDTIEDSTASIEEKKKLSLAFIDSLYKEDYSIIESMLSDIKAHTINEDDLLLVNNFKQVFARFTSFDKSGKNIGLKYLSEMREGMCLFMEKSIESFEDLDLYCYYVAGTVGLYLNSLLNLRYGIKLPKDLAVKTGNFLQKVNITRDFKKDFSENRIFYPLSLFKTYPAQSLYSGEMPEKEASSILYAMCENAMADEKEAFQYISLLPKEAKGFKHFVLISCMMAHKTFEKIHLCGGSFYFATKPVKISRFDVYSIIAKTFFGFYSKAYLKKKFGF